MNELHLFAGAGGGIIAGELVGNTAVCAVESNKYCQGVLLQRQRDGILPKFPIWDDIRTFDGKPWRDKVDAICGGFPCQDISVSGKGEGLAGERSGLWSEFDRVVREVEPRYVFVENSPMLTSRGLGRVLGDLAIAGYDAKWVVLGTDDVGGIQTRKRIWILATKRDAIDQNDTDSLCIRRDSRAGKSIQSIKQTSVGSGFNNLLHPNKPAFEGWKAEPAVGRVAHGVANGVDRLRAIGNGQVPAVAAYAWRYLSQAS